MMHRELAIKVRVNRKHTVPRAKKIVVVDDDTEMNQAVARLLKAAGFRTVTFPSGAAFLESGTADSAACLILDVHLPGFSGFELQRRLHERGNRSPVIFMTAYDDPASELLAQAAGAIAYLTKPFPRKAFLGAITQALSSQPGQRELKLRANPS